MPEEFNFVVEDATRASIKPLIALFGKSGGGKTHTALILARGIVGPKGRIVLIDSENRRGSIFAESRPGAGDAILPGSYKTIDLQPPFSPARYKAAFEAAEKAADIVVVDSGSHEWDGEGGVLDMQETELYRMAQEDWKKREQCKMAAWIKPKEAHKHFVQYLLRCPLPVIICFRGQEKTRMLREEGKTKVKTDDFSTPITDPRLIFEMLFQFEVVSRDGKGGHIQIARVPRPECLDLLPAEDEQVTYEHGKKIAAWCAGTVTPTAAPQTQPLSASKAERNALLMEVWKHTLVQAVHNLPAGQKATDPDKQKVNQFLLDENYISDTEVLGELGVERLKQVLAKLNQKLSERTQQ